MKNNQGKKGLALTLALCLASAALAFGGIHTGLLRSVPAVAESAVTEPAPVQDASPAVYVSQKNANSVVGVVTSTDTWNRSTGEVEKTPVSQGSGVVVAEGGYVLTNNHVIEDGDSYQVLMPSGDKIDAQLVGADSSTDLAVLKVSEGAETLVPVTLGSTDGLPVGSTVVAIGNPGGEVLANTVTQGIVSALERTSVNSSNTTRRIHYIQHDAAINSGNSGGGLFNYKGELIGINTLKYSGSAWSGSTYEGLGFAIPVETAEYVANQLIENGKVLRPGLGVTVMNYEGPDEPLNNQAPASVAIMSVLEGGAAEAAGLQQYDFITEVDGERVTTLMDLTSVLDLHEAGDTVSVKVVRYQQAGMMQTQTNTDPFGFGYGFGYNFGYGDAYGSGSSELVARGGYEEVTVEVTLQIIE
ncbi:MAG: trypsin-like peptidase domain-containing protein [Clostridia bacterium]|nr:trypsin-like peptidase domain-containing protein [Clostridia bacterium]